MKKMLLFGAILLAVGGVFVSGQDDILPDSIVFNHPGLRPEGIEYHHQGEHFLVSSISEGTIFSVSDNGDFDVFIEDEDLGATLGIHIDDERKRLLVANNIFEPGNPPKGYLGIYDLVSGNRIAMVDLTELLTDAATVVNDITVDIDGNAYVTNHMSAVIYQIDLEGNAAIFIRDERLGHPMAGANGIEYHPDGYLLVGSSYNWAIFKVPLEDPTEMKQVELDIPIGPDGIFLHPDGTLIVAGFDFIEGDLNPQTIGEKRVYATYMLESEDDWESASVVGRVATERFGTTTTIRDDVVYTILSDVSDPTVESFEIIRIDFDSKEN